MRIDDVVGACPIDQVVELLSRTWESASEEQRREFAEAKADELREVLPLED